MGKKIAGFDEREAGAEEHLEPAAGVARREVLQAGILGLAASAVGARTAAAKCPQPPAPPGACEAPAPVPTPAECLPLDLQGAEENWNEPWVWRPGDWPGDQLDLNVVENQNPGLEVGLGNPGSVFFSYGGNTPGPTIRMRGDETLSVKLRNMLGEDCGQTFVGPFPDTNEIPTEAQVAAAKAKATARGQLRFDFCLGEHTNGLHSAHVTNLHTHGLHVRPDKNPDGTHSDNVILRLLSQADFKRRERAVRDQDATCVCGHETRAARCEKCGSEVVPTPACGIEGEPEGALSACRFLRNPDEDYFVRDDELVGEANYEFRLGNLPNFPVHPPGTHWYHPHAHGATDIQVSSGMAGYLIIEGDVDEAINCALTGSEQIDPGRKTGPWDYRERLMFMQRIFPGNVEGDPQSPKSQLKKRPIPAANGSEKAAVINMRPGAIERWRVINGSVDGRGFKHVMVLEGQYQVITTGFQSSGLPIAPVFRVDPPAKGKTEPKLTEVTFGNWDQLIEGKKCHLWQLAVDGVTLVRKGASGEPEYYIKDLAQQNPGSKYPPSQPCKRKIPKGKPNAKKLCRVESVFEDCDSVRAAWVRPDEFFMGPANRTDLFFQLPLGAKCGDVYTVIAIASVIHADTPVFNLQQTVGKSEVTPGPVSIVVAHIVVTDDSPVDGVKDSGAAEAEGKIGSLNGCLPPVPRYLYPVEADELKDEQGKYRSRVVKYSGWGNEGLPLVTNAGSDPTAKKFQKFIDSQHGSELRGLRYVENDGVDVLLSPAIRTMSINGRKFNPTDPERAQVLVDTCEQWVVYNTTQTLWAYTAPDKQPKGQFKGHYVSYPIDRATGQKVFWNQKDLYDYDPETCEPPDFRIVTRGIDHPFHIHQNPFWVLRIEIPDRHGNLCNILDEPRWMDSLWIPRNNGRIVFRSRFPDYVGASVHHCHILQHEDNGMMTAFQLTPFPGLANNEQWDFAIEAIPPGPDGDELKRPSLEDSYRLNFTFVDPNLPHGKSHFVAEKPDQEIHDPGANTGQVYPGFEVEPPAWPPEDE